MGGCVNRSCGRQKLPRIPQSYLNLPKEAMKLNICTIWFNREALGLAQGRTCWWVRLLRVCVTKNMSQHVRANCGHRGIDRAHWKSGLGHYVTAQNRISANSGPRPSYVSQSRDVQPIGFKWTPSEDSYFKHGCGCSRRLSRDRAVFEVEVELWRPASGSTFG